MTRGTLYLGTSGFSYRAWTPRFYAAGIRADDLLAAYATRLNACELNNTYYQQPTPGKIAAWLAATRSDFRFVVKAQRSSSLRAIGRDPAESVPWLTAPLGHFGDRLGAVLFRVPEDVRRDDGRLDRLLAAWPATIPLVLEFQDPSWHVDEVFARLGEHGAVLCATDLDTDPGPPDLRLLGSFLYLRLRRTSYDEAEIAAWAHRIGPFLDAGHDVYAFFRHDETGESPLRALRLGEIVAAGRQ